MPKKKVDVVSERTKGEPVKKQRGGRSGAGFDVNPQNINTEGRPDNPWTWRELFMKIAEEKKGQKTRKEIAAEAQWAEMEKGNVKAFEKIVDRMEGKALEKVDHTSGGEKITGFVVEFVHETKNQDSTGL